jgi:hypothetical protein
LRTDRVMAEKRAFSKESTPEAGGLFKVSEIRDFSVLLAQGGGEPKIPSVMGNPKPDTFQVACPDCGAMILVDAHTGLVISHTSAPRKRMFEDLETAAKAMREHDERKESIFRQSVDAEKNKDDLFDKKFAEALKKAKDAPAGKPLRDFDLD